MNPEPPRRFKTMSTAEERMFPKLTPKQIERAAAHGHARQVEDGEIIIEAGQRNVPFFIIETPCRPDSEPTRAAAPCSAAGPRAALEPGLVLRPRLPTCKRCR